MKMKSIYRRNMIWLLMNYKFENKIWSLDFDMDFFMRMIYKAMKFLQ